MRTIKFRGKCAKGSRYAGEWVYGSCVQCEKSNDVLITVAFNDRCSCTYHVDPATVGQFTGLHDKHGHEIYEGDVIRINLTDGSTNKSSVFWNNRRGYWGCDIDIINHGVQLGLIDKVRIEVIGNIHDNPELIKKGGNDESDVH